LYIFEVSAGYEAKHELTLEEEVFYFHHTYQWKLLPEKKYNLFVSKSPVTRFLLIVLTAAVTYTGKHLWGAEFSRT
jgi:hypothetical protein